MLDFLCPPVTPGESLPWQGQFGCRSSSLASGASGKQGASGLVLSTQAGFATALCPVAYLGWEEEGGMNGAPAVTSKEPALWGCCVGLSLPLSLFLTTIAAWALCTGKTVSDTTSTSAVAAAFSVQKALAGKTSLLLHPNTALQQLAYPPGCVLNELTMTLLSNGI